MPEIDRNAGNENVGTLERRAIFWRWSRRFLCLAVIAAIGVGGFRVYGKWREQHLVRQMQAFAVQGEYQSTVLVARRVLALNADNLAASRTMAELAEKAGRIDALVWRKKTAYLAPNSAEDRIAWARAALRFGQPNLAEDILNALPEAAQQNIDYHQLAGACALMQQQPARAETHFAAALQLDPKNPQPALNLAILHLVSSDAQIANEARATLIGLSDQAAVRSEALRALAANAIARREKSEARKWANQLNNEKNATFSDALLHLETVESTEDFPSASKIVSDSARASSGTTAELIAWLNRHGRAQDALAWSASLPLENQRAYPVPLAIAEAYSFLQDWTGLRDFVGGKNWGQFEALRLAVESHALHRLSPSDRTSMEAETVWNAALKKAKSNPEQLITIAQLADGWGYQNEANETWWTIAGGNENPRAALSALQRIYKSTKDTHGLLRVARRALELNPNDLVAANNCANLGLLLNGDSTARRLAFKLHREHPTNRAFAATCAFALSKDGKLADGLKLMGSLSEEELQHPSLAAYYVVLLVEGKDFERARSYLANAQRAALLPEEEQMLNSAARQLVENEAQEGVKSVATRAR